MKAHQLELGATLLNYAVTAIYTKEFAPKVGLAVLIITDISRVN